MERAEAVIAAAVVKVAGYPADPKRSQVTGARSALTAFERRRLAKSKLESDVERNLKSELAQFPQESATGASVVVAGAGGTGMEVVEEAPPGADRSKGEANLPRQTTKAAFVSPGLSGAWVTAQLATLRDPRGQTSAGRTSRARRPCARRCCRGR